VRPASEEGLLLLGLLAVDVRFCQFGSTEIVSLQESAKRARVAAVPTEPLLNAARVARDADGWSHGARLHWPATVEMLVDDSQPRRPVKPLLVRENVETWVQESRGAPVQLEAKRERGKMARHAVSVYQPHGVNSAGRRLRGGPEQRVTSTWSLKAHGERGPFPTSVAEMVVRPVGFDPAAERASKRHFAAFMNGHCSHRKSASLGVIVRELFTFALCEYKLVSALGGCPFFQSERLRVSYSERVKAKAAYERAGTVDAFRDHKFAIAFENTGADSYVSEKLVNAFLGRSVPVYFGPGPATVREHLNPKAIIYCDLPPEFSSETHLNELRARECAKQLPAPAVLDSRECHLVFMREVERGVWPALKRCVEQVRRVDEDDRLYEAMLAEPLVPGARLVGVWNRTLSGELLRAAYDVLGYAS